MCTGCRLRHSTGLLYSLITHGWSSSCLTVTRRLGSTYRTHGETTSQCRRDNTIQQAAACLKIPHMLYKLYSNHYVNSKLPIFFFLFKPMCIEELKRGLVCVYLHHLVEEEDTGWRQPPGVIVFTSLRGHENTL